MEQTFETLLAQIGQSAYDRIHYNKTIASIHQQIVVSFITDKAQHYSDVLKMDKLDILKAWETLRGDTLAINFYQEHKLPSLDKVHIFKTAEDFKTAFPSHKSKCPQCKGISADYYRCNSGLVVKDNTCMYEATTLLGDNDAHIRILILELFKDFPAPHMIFKPIELVPEEKAPETPIRKLV